MHQVCVQRRPARRLLVLAVAATFAGAPLRAQAQSQVTMEAPEVIGVWLEEDIIGAGQPSRMAMGEPTECGDPLATDCFVPVFGPPFCDDMCFAEPCAPCCDIVCAIDPGCCIPESEPGGFGWDGICVDNAMTNCGCQPGDEPPNDECIGAVEVGLGPTAITNLCSSTGGPDHNANECSSDIGLAGLDVWYTYNSTFTGELKVFTCNQLDSTWDSLILVYEGCDCANLSDPPLACNDDGIDDDLNECSFGSSFARLDVTMGTCYTIRIGSNVKGTGGAGTLTLEIGSSEPCSIDDLIPPDAMEEPEACGEDTNGGCDNLPDNPATFTSVQCGDVIHGTSWSDAFTFDSDWYELVIAEQTLVTFSLNAELGSLFGIVETVPKGSGDCTTLTGQFLPFEIAAPCLETSFTTLMFPGTHWPFVKPLISDGVCGGDSGNDYVLTIACACDDPSICIDGDPCTDDTCLLISGTCPHLPTDCDDGDACTFDTCDSAVGCEHTPFDVPVDCDDGDACTADTCDSALGCVNTPLCMLDGDCNDGHPCTSDFCGADGCCATTPGCVEDADCFDPADCRTGVCGSGGCCLSIPDCEKDCDCDDQDVCTTDTCTEGGCCDNVPIDVGAVCDDGNPCTDATCDAVLGCANTPFDPAIGCDDNDACTIDTCDEVVGCQHTPIDVAQICDDSNACTVDTCEAAAGCVNTPQEPTVFCNDDDACTTDVCNIVQGCQNFPIDVEVECGDGNSCTTDSCEPASGCLNVAECADAAECDDADSCTIDSCSPDGCCVNARSCVTGCPPADLNGDGEVGPFDLATLLGSWGTDPGGPPDFNGDGTVGPFDLAVLLGAWGPCSTQASLCCSVQADCDDGNACTTDTCELGQCCKNTPECSTNADCDDGDPCTINTCTLEGCCQLVANDCLVDLDCDDGLACTTDTCGGDFCCVNTPDECAIDLDCDDSDPCTTDSCTPQGCCENIQECVPFGACSDGDPCTIDTCGADGCCLSVPTDCQADIDCDDGNACTADVCTPEGCCENTIECQSDGDCNDGNTCTVDVCILPEGCCLNVPQCSGDADCDDGDGCTTDSCDADGCCLNTPLCTSDLNCGDGDPCTVDTCGPDGCCTSVLECAVDGDCDDGDPCTTGSCGPGGCCVHTPDCTVEADCDDANACTADSCGPGGCCIHDAECQDDCDCDDLDPCTEDICDPDGCCVSAQVEQCCTPSDMNNDSFCTIVFDVDLFVQCVYLGNCVGAGGEDLICPADCSCDGLATIVFDVECFLTNVFINGTCGACSLGAEGSGLGRAPRGGSEAGFTIGGAVFADATNPLMSGLEDAVVTVRRSGGRDVFSTTTNALGLWQLDEVPAGDYTVRFRPPDRHIRGPKRPMKISVNEENVAANLSIKWLATSIGGRP